MTRIPLKEPSLKKKNPYVIFLVGPTAMHKSDLGIELAQRLNGEIISADSMQIYCEMNIGTAKPGRKDRKKVPHHLIDILKPTRSFSVFHYRQLALKKISEIQRHGRIPVVVGGTGLYVRALLEGLSAQPGADRKLRKRLRDEARAKGLICLYERLCRIDHESGKKIKPTDERRIVRALEIVECSGKTPSDWYGRKQSLVDLGLKPIVLGLIRERSELYRAIEERVDRMFDEGLVDEVCGLIKKRLSVTARQAVGYKEIIQVLKGKSFEDGSVEGKLKEAKELVKRNTRRYAKRQITWFKKEKGIRWFEWTVADSIETMADKLTDEIRKEMSDAEG